MTDERDIEKCGFQPKFRHVVLLAFLCLIVTWAGFRFTVKGKLDDAYVQIRADGYPVTPAEFDKWYSIPEGKENAADMIIEAFGYYSYFNEEMQKLLPVLGKANFDEERQMLLQALGKAKFPDTSESMPEDVLEIVGEYIEGNAKALELLHKGAVIDYCRYPDDLRFSRVTPSVSDIAEAALRLELEAVYCAEKGEVERAIGSLKAAIWLEGSLSKELFHVSQLGKWACRVATINSLEYLINYAELTDDQLTDIYNSFGNLIGYELFEHTIVSERCLGIAFFNMPTRGDAILLPWPEKMATLAYKVVGLADLDQLLYIDMINDYVVAAKLSLLDAKKAFDAADSKYANISDSRLMFKYFGRISASLDSFANKEVLSQVQLNAARTTISIERYRIVEGRLPDSLSGLVPKYMNVVPIDPFDGKELKYKRLETGYVVYSIGQDGVDNGGQKREKGHAEYDEVFRVAR